MIISSNLQGFKAEPFFIKPEKYDLMVYFAEWYFEAILPDVKLRQLIPGCYNRSWGKSKVFALPTLFYSEKAESFLVDDITSGVRKLLRSNGGLSIFPTDSLNQLKDGLLKELGSAYRFKLEGYYMSPLIPAEVDTFKIYKLSQTMPLSPAEAVEVLNKESNQGI